MFGKEFINIRLNIVQPDPALGRRAGHNHIEHPAVKVGNTAEAEDTVFPDGLQRIAKNISFSLSFRIGGIENKHCPCFE